MLEGKEIYLGLDISTKTIGVCVLADDGTPHGNILELTHITPRAPKNSEGIEELFIKKGIFEEFIYKYKDYGVDHVVIEEPLLLSNNALTVSTLLRFNGMISDTIYRLLGVVPDYISSYDARKYAFPELMSVRKYGKDEVQYPYGKIIEEIKHGRLVLFGSYPWTIDKKLVIQGKVAEFFPTIEWVKDSHGELKRQNFDASDAYVAILGQLNLKRNGDLKFSVSNIKEQSDGRHGRTVEYDVSYWNRKEHRTTYIA